VAAKKTAAKKSGAKKSAGRRPRVKREKAPMSKDFHDLASQVAGTFTEGILSRGGSVSAKDSKNKDAVQVSGKVGDVRLVLRVSQRG
jgi:hypothetical protein